MDNLSNELLAMVRGYLDETPLYRSRTQFAPPPPWLRSLRVFRSDTRGRRKRKSGLVGYATVSRQWQASVEERTMSSIHIVNGELGKFAAVFEDPRRRRLLKHLHYTIELSTYGNTRGEHAANCAVFEQATIDLFRLLGAWEQQQQQQQDGKSIGPLELELDVVWNPPCEVHERNYEIHMSAAGRRYLTLSADGPRQLPNLHSIAALTIFSNFSCAPHPSAACAIAAAAPRLRSLHLQFLDLVERRVELRRQNRAALAAGLLSALRAERDPIRLVLERKHTTDYDHEPADLEQDGADDLCVALRLLGEQGRLCELMLHGVLISERLFRSPEGNTWPALRRFRMLTGFVAASGRGWYTGDRNAVEPQLLTDPDNESAASTDRDIDDLAGMRDAVANGDFPYYLLRMRPNPATFDQLMEAAAEAMLRMPVLESGWVEVGEPITSQVQWVVAGVEFPDMRRRSSPEKLAVRRCAVKLDAKWDVPENVTRLWKQWVGDDGTSEIKQCSV